VGFALLHPPYKTGVALIKTAAAILAIFTILSVAMYWIDKSRAMKDKPRISEVRLLQLAFIGPLRSTLGIWWMRHKTRKVSFLIKYSIVFALSVTAHAGIGFWIYSHN